MFEPVIWLFILVLMPGFISVIVLLYLMILKRIGDQPFR
jgi:hypothetical protein